MQQLRTVRRIAAKEIELFFASPTAYLFLGSFAAVTLFVFFWGEAFFARNVADVRPLFEWMPVLLIFLTSSLTMRLWSEERRSGTLEHVKTAPVPLWHFVAGKFLGCMALLCIALAITAPLPVTVSFLGDLDWGPVLGGYLATFLLGAAYLSVGLFISALCQSQIVSLLSSVAVCGFFYLIGSPVLTEFFGSPVDNWLRLLGAGSRFDSITRGFIDFRDLYYYVGMVLVFLTLNTFVLESERWGTGGGGGRHANWRIITLLVLANAVGANLWLGQIQRLRVDTTEGRQFTLTQATRTYLDRLEEPLLLRGYFSSKTHPLLAPLAPQLKDLLHEYGVAGGRRLRVEIVDPTESPELEQEAHEEFGIRPVPLQVADRHQASIVSSYFHVLVKYGNEKQVLSFQDLIEIKAKSDVDIEVSLRNPEYDLTRAIKKVTESYRGGGEVMDAVEGELVLAAYLSPDDRLPEKLVEFRKTVEQVTGRMQESSGGRFRLEVRDPEAGDGALAQEIAEKYGFVPMVTDLFSGRGFYFYLVLEQAETAVQVPMGKLDKNTFKRDLEAGIKRFARGFGKTVALVGDKDLKSLREFLGEELTVLSEDLKDGRVDGRADVLVLVSPKDLDRKSLFAVDQFLMKGGTVVAVTSPYKSDYAGSRLRLSENQSGLEEWLAHYGLSIDKQLIMDPQCSSLPLPVTRTVGGYPIREFRMVDYPYFLDMRAGQFARSHPITEDLKQLTMGWTSPIQVDSEKQGERKVVELLHSSQASWLNDSTEVTPSLGGVYRPVGKLSSHPVGILTEGRFDSFFAGQDSPLKDELVAGVIERSPQRSRLVIFSSNEFLDDRVLQLNGKGNQYLQPLKLMANTVDWALEDQGLLSMRSRGSFDRTLRPMEQRTQLFWEYLNYFLSALALGLVALFRYLRQAQRRRRHQEILAS